MRLKLFLALILSSFLLPKSASAYVAGGTGSISLSPTTSATWVIGENASILVNINSGTTAISGVSFKITVPVVSADIEGVSVTAGTIENWSFPIKTITTTADTITIDFSGLDISTTGTTTNGSKLLATIVLKPKKSLSSKAVTFSVADTAMYRKSDGADILGSYGNGSYSTTGNPVPTTPVTVAPTATATVAPTTTATVTTAATVTSSSSTTTTTTTATTLPASGIMDNLVYIGLAGAALFIIPLFFLF